jgi:hypothetical protein
MVTELIFMSGGCGRQGRIGTIFVQRVRDSCSSKDEKRVHPIGPEANGSLLRYPLLWLEFFEEILPSESPDSRGDGLRKTFRLGG